MSFFRNIFKSFSNENSMAGAYDDEPKVTVSGNVHIQPTMTVSASTTTGNNYNTTTNYNSNNCSHMQPHMGVSVGVAQPTIGMSVSTTSYDSTYNTVSVQPTVGVSMNMGVQQPSVGIGFNMGMPNMSVSTTTTTTTSNSPNYNPPPQQPQPVANFSSGNLAQKIISACNNSSFDSDKVKAVVSYSSAECSPILARDLVSILQLFSFGNDQVKVMNQLKSTNNMAQMSCNDAVQILNVFGHDNDKIKVLDIIKPQVYDRRQSTETIVGTFSFSNDKDKARKMLLQ